VQHQNCYGPLCTANRLTYDIACISQITTPIDNKFQDNIWTTKLSGDAVLWRHNKSKMADGRHFKVYQQTKFRRHISVKNHPILIKLRILMQILNPMTVTWPKIEIFKIKDGGCRHLENCFFGYNSSTDCPISAKFCMRKQNGMSTRATWQKLQICKIQDGRRPPFWKSLNRHISVKNRPILTKFGTLQQMLNTMTVTWPKIYIF